MLFGDDFEQHCRVLTMATYRGEWPVNRLAQGEDVTTAMPVQGLYLVGDAVKPAGYLMVEGVAQSVNYALDALNSASETMQPDDARKRHVLSPPPRRNALRWLWKAPGNADRVSTQGAKLS